MFEVYVYGVYISRKNVLKITGFKYISITPALRLVFFMGVYGVVGGFVLLDQRG